MPRFTLLLWFLLLPVLLWACTPTPMTAPADYFRQAGLAEKFTPAQFQICYTGGCTKTAAIGLSEAQWQSIRALFPGDRSAAEERAAIARAVAQLETLSGQQSLTANDKGGNFTGFGEKGQQDCVDESTNTTLYLTLMAQDGLLHHHQVLHPTSRGFFVNGYPHRTASVAETESGMIYVVDSWFEDNGREPHVVPYEDWAAGWSPGKP